MANDPLSWAPSQHKGMKCACVDPDAQNCYRLRQGIPLYISHLDHLSPQHWDDEDITEKCDCCCHDRDWEEEDDY